MALNFPNNPLDGATWVDPANGALYKYEQDTNSWSVTGVSVGGGTVNSVTIAGLNGVKSTGGPITDVGIIELEIDINALNILPPSD